MTNNILIVEPDRSISEEMCKRLRSFGFSVESTDCIASAMDAASALSPDLIVLDHCLADLEADSGPHLDTVWAKDAALVLVASDQDVHAANSANAMGASSLLTQPFSGNDLLDSVSHALWQTQDAANDACF